MYIPTYIGLLTIRYSSNCANCSWLTFDVVSPVAASEIIPIGRSWGNETQSLRTSWHLDNLCRWGRLCFVQEAVVQASVCYQVSQWENRCAALRESANNLEDYRSRQFNYCLYQVSDAVLCWTHFCSKVDVPCQIPENVTTIIGPGHL